MTFTITAQQRAAGKGAEERESGNIPGVVYGPEIEPQALTVPATTFQKLYDEAGSSNLIDLDLGGNSITVLIQDVQYNPVKQVIIHVDFRQIKMGEAMTATTELRFTGEAPAVKTLGGTLQTGVSSVEISCLPKDLIGHIDVDLSVLATFDDVIHVKDLQVPDTVTLTDNPETVVATVTPPLTEEQLKAMDEADAGSVDDIEVEEKGKKEEDGDAPAAEEKPAEEKKAE